MRSLERVNIRTNIRTGQTLYPLHNFVVRGDNKHQWTVKQTGYVSIVALLSRFGSSSSANEIESYFVLMNIHKKWSHDR